MTDRPVLVAPDKFKGTFTAAEVAAAMTTGLESAGFNAETCQIADGGEGTLDVVHAAIGGIVEAASVSDALGRERTARVLAFDDGRSALVEVADAIGLGAIEGAERDAVAASSFGAGELIAAAAATAVREVFVGIGGTATTDGGGGAIEALREARLIGKRGALKRCPRITVLCDVRAAWEQAAPVFAPQKGASKSEVSTLTQRLEVLANELPRDPSGKLLTGAGGGLSGGLWAAADGALKGGAAWVLDRVGFPDQLQAARAVVTGEGSLDGQTLLGKAVGEVATQARQSGVPCHVIAGQTDLSEFECRILDFETHQTASSTDEIAAAAEALAPAMATR